VSQLESFPSPGNSIPAQDRIKAKPLRGRCASLDTVLRRYQEPLRGKRQERQTLRTMDLPGHRLLVPFRTAREMGQPSRKSSRQVRLERIQNRVLGQLSHTDRS